MPTNIVNSADSSVQQIILYMFSFALALGFNDFMKLVISRIKTVQNEIIVQLSYIAILFVLVVVMMYFFKTKYYPLDG